MVTVPDRSVAPSTSQDVTVIVVGGFCTTAVRPSPLPLHDIVEVTIADSDVLYGFLNSVPSAPLTAVETFVPDFLLEQTNLLVEQLTFKTTQQDSIINVYKSKAKEGVSNLYVPIKSIVQESGTRRSEYLYDDPRTLVGRFRALVRGLERVNTKLMNNPTYQKAAMKSPHATARSRRSQ